VTTAADLSGAGAGPAWFTAAVGQAPEELLVSHQGTTVSSRVWGPEGAPGVVLVHGGAANASWWDHIGPLLTTGGYRVVAVDMSGHGDSGRRPEYTLELWAGELLAVIASAAFARPPVVVGHSMGGFVTLRLARLAPEQIGGVVAIDAPIRTLSRQEQAARGSLVGSVQRVYPTREAAVARFRPVPDQVVLPYVRDHVAARSVHQVEGGWTWTYDQTVFQRPPFRAEDLVPRTPRVGLVSTERGLVARDGHSAEFEMGVGSTGINVELPDSGHHPMLDQPLALATVLRTFAAMWSR
jgi:pimeloyl-ACP methyl ester carboxylesterase